MYPCRDSKVVHARYLHTASHNRGGFYHSALCTSDAHHSSKEWDIVIAGLSAWLGPRRKGVNTLRKDLLEALKACLSLWKRQTVAFTGTYLEAILVLRQPLNVTNRSA